MTMKPNEMTPSVARNNQYQAPFQSGRWLDPVRAAALHEAVIHIGNHLGYYAGIDDVEDPQPAGQVLTMAERFERYLVGESNGDSEDAR